MKRILTTAVALTLCCVALRAEVRLNPLFTDNMVLRQKSEVPVWGEASPGAEISICTSWSRSCVTTVADESGKWKTLISTPKGSFKPRSLSISENGNEPIVLDNVLIGEVWLCSGQSNMEMPVQGWAIPLNEDVIASASENRGLHLLTVERAIGMRPHDEFSAKFGGWTESSPETVRDFSATAYFFGLNMLKNLNVPVGLINTCWGGTIIEAWMSPEKLSEFAPKRAELALVESLPEDKDSLLAVYNAMAKDFDATLDSYDKGMLEEWYQPSANDRIWIPLNLPCLVQEIYPDDNGVFWFRKWVDIPAEWEGHELTLGLCGIDDLDDSYWNGVKVGSGAGWKTPRRYVIPAESVKAGPALVCVRNTDTGGTGGVWDNAEDLFVEGPDGSRISLAGEWLCKQSVSFRGNYSIMPPRIVDNPNLCSVLYNAMIRPLVPYAVSGAIWYQGCANAGHPFEYRDLMEGLILDWREKWGYDFDFYITQLSGYQAVKPEPATSVWAEIRESQARSAATIKGAGLATTIDIGEAFDIHPRTKDEVGRRLALAALSGTYGKKVEASGPVLESWTVDGSSIRLKFSHCGEGLEVDEISREWAGVRWGEAFDNGQVNAALEGALVGFQIAGTDHKFRWAEAKIVSATEIVVSHPDIKTPIAVRYGWADNPVCNLESSTGLPAVPFRTDDWTISDQIEYLK